MESSSIANKVAIGQINIVAEEDQIRSLKTFFASITNVAKNPLVAFHDGRRRPSS